MIEQAMMFALGFLTAGLLTLLFLPAVWRRALRLSTRRLEMLLPLSVAEIVAERDQLRAGFAVERRRLEQNQEASQEARAEDAAELGRRATKLAEISAAADSLRDDVGKLERDGANVLASLADAQAEASGLHVALYQSEGLRERREQVLRGLEDAHQILQITTGQQQVAHFDLESRHNVTDMALRTSERGLDEARRELAQRKADIDILMQERDQALAQALFFTQRRDALQADLTALTERTAGLEISLADARAQMAASARDYARAAETAAAFERQILDMQQRHKATQDRAERALERAYSIESETARRLEVMRGEKAAVEGALHAARGERSRLQRELGLAQTAETLRARGSAALVGAPLGSAALGSAALGGADDEAALRRAISDLADRLLRLHAPRSAAPAAPPAVVPQLRARTKIAVEKIPASAEPPAA